MYQTFHELIRGYLDTKLKGKASYENRCNDARSWILTLTSTPTRKQILERHKAKGHGDFEAGATAANAELSLIRAACRWGMYQEVWDGGDPTAGIRKWKTAKRKRSGKFGELAALLHHLARASTYTELRDRAVFGLELFTGCRPSEARKTRLDAITPYGDMGAWIKGKTKTGENQELPLPKQLMPWIDAWKAIRSRRPNPYLFPGQWDGQPITEDTVNFQWNALRTRLNITGLWNYDLRRTLACSMSNELGIDDGTIRAILNHADVSALGHYRFKSFDSLTKPIQQYADWLLALTERLPSSSPMTVEERHRIAFYPREQEILGLFAQGRSDRQIAQELAISVKTVRDSRDRIMRKAQLKTMAQLIRFGRERQAGLIPAQPMPWPTTNPAPVVPVMPPSLPIVYMPRPVEQREEWPG
jgi:integrase/DNA-binding CsgD family transcriptional regulator